MLRNKDEHNNMQPKVSIIVPCWGVEKYLDRCVNSLVNQTLRDIEIILVDDESPDQVPEMCDAWAEKDNRIKVIHKKNGGLGYARNTGLDNASGEYVMFLDSDDTYELDVCERFYNVAKQYDADIVTGNFNTEIAPGIWRKTDQPEGQVILKGDEVRHFMLDMIATAPHVRLERLYPVSVCLTCTRRMLIQDNNLRFMSEREVASEDTVFKVSMLQKCQVLVREPYAFYSYFFNGESLSRNFSLTKFKQLKTLHTILCEMLKDDDEALERIDRFLISDTRPHIQRLVLSKLSHKITILRIIVNDDLWNKVKKYRPSNFPLYQHIFYSLTLKKHVYLLYFFVKMIKLLKRFN